MPTERQFDAEVWVYDGLTGALLARERVSELGKGEVMVSPPRPFASAAFWQSDYGQAVDRALDLATRKISDVISCIPFSARIVKLSGPRQVYINAGSLDGIAVGDKFLIYQRKSAQPVRDLISGRELGVPETLAGDVTISQVQPISPSAQCRRRARWRKAITCASCRGAETKPARRLRPGRLSCHSAGRRLRRMPIPSDTPVPFPIVRRSAAPRPAQSRAAERGGAAMPAIAGLGGDPAGTVVNDITGMNPVAVAQVATPRSSADIQQALRQWPGRCP